MAIIFVSIRKRQRMFFLGISLMLILALAIISLGVVFPEFRTPSKVVVQEVFNAPDVKINFNVLDSAEVKNLEPFSSSEIEAMINPGRPNPFIK